MPWSRTAPQPRPFRNLLINGAMNVAQRGTSTANITANSYNTADRWYSNFAGTAIGTWTQSVENDAPSGTGLKKSLKMLVTTADASPAAGDLLQIEQRIEGQNLQTIQKGTSNAQTITVSFWVKSNVTGTYVCRFYENDNNRNCGATYSINSSATWEKKTITFPADTAGALDNDNGDSLRLVFQLAVGSNWTSSALQTTWGTFSTTGAATGQTNVAAATNNYWQITGVQMEVGSSASDFEYVPYDFELQRCLRYYWRLENPPGTQLTTGQAWATRSVDWMLWMPVTMRAKPDAISIPSNITGVVSTNSDIIGGTVTHTINYSRTTLNNFFVTTTGTSGGTLTAGNACMVGNQNGGSTAYITVSAEL